jgi:hypothetical protein
VKKCVFLFLALSLFMAGCQIILPFDPRFGKTVVSGVVNDYLTGNPVQGAIVSINDTQYTTDQNGRYETMPLPQGKNTIDCLADGYAPEQKPVMLTENNMTVNFLLKIVSESTEGKLSGYVSDSETKKLLKDVTVKLIQDNDVYVADITGDNGKYEFWHIPAGAFKIIASCSGYVDYDKEITIHVGSQAENIDLNKSAP